MTAAKYKAARKLIGTQTQVAAMLGVNRVTVAKRESGAVEITKEAGLALARIFAICDVVAVTNETIRTEKEGEESSKVFLGLLPVVTKYPLGPALEPLTVHPDFVDTKLTDSKSLLQR